MEKQELQRKIIATILTVVGLCLVLTASIWLLITSAVFSGLIQWLMIGCCVLLAAAIIGFLRNKLIEIRTLRTCVQDRIVPSGRVIHPYESVENMLDRTAWDTDEDDTSVAMMMPEGFDMDFSSFDATQGAATYVQDTFAAARAQSAPTGNPLASGAAAAMTAAAAAAPVVNAPVLQSTQQRPATTAQQPMMQQQRPATMVQQPMMQQQRPATMVQQPMMQQQRPATTVQQPMMQQQRPATTVQQPMMQQQRPATTVQQPMMQQQRPATTAQQPMMQQQRPATTAQPPMMQQQRPATTAQPPMMQQQRPATSAQPSVEAEAPRIKLNVAPIAWPRADVSTPMAAQPSEAAMRTAPVSTYSNEARLAAEKAVLAQASERARQELERRAQSEVADRAADSADAAAHRAAEAAARATARLRAAAGLPPLPQKAGFNPASATAPPVSPAYVQPQAPIANAMPVSAPVPTTATPPIQPYNRLQNAPVPQTVSSWLTEDRTAVPPASTTPYRR